MSTVEPAILLRFALLLDSSTYKVFVVLLSISNSDGEVFTSLADLKSRTNLSISTIRRSLQCLESQKILQTNYVVGVSTEYKFIFLD